MDANTLTTLVSSLGFPIVCCAALFWYVNKTMKDSFDKIDHTIQQLSTSIASNTDATTKLVTTVELLTRIGGDEQ